MRKYCIALKYHADISLMCRDIIDRLIAEFDDPVFNAVKAARLLAICDDCLRGGSSDTGKRLECRLIRRIVRDARTRGTSAKETIARWPSVRRGEEANIFPYQEQADVMFNSSLAYELCVLKPIAISLLKAIDKNIIEYIEAKRLMKFFNYLLPFDSKCVPSNSILREYIGNSCFDV